MKISTAPLFQHILVSSPPQPLTILLLVSERQMDASSKKEAENRLVGLAKRAELFRGT